MSDTIEIKLSGRQIPPEKFLSAVQKFLAIVQGVGRNIAGLEDPIQWTVEADHGSAIIRAKALNRPQEAAQSTDAIRRGFHSLRSGTNIIPRGFTALEARATQELAELIDDDFPISVKNGDAPEELTRDIVKTVDALLRRDKYEDFGSIEGVLCSMARGNRFECEIKDQQSGRTVHCYFNADEVAKQAWAAFLKDRIIARGLVRYAKEGHPTSMLVDSIQGFPEESELPTIEDIQNIFQSSQ